MPAPRIGRADRLAELAQAQAQVIAPEWSRSGALLRPPAMTRLLASPAPPALPAPISPKALAEAAGQLAALLEPLPNALHELGVRVSRHCANTDRDAELARDASGGQVRSLTGALALLLLAGCAHVVVPNDPGGRRAALCATRAEAEVPGTWAIVEEIAAKSPTPGLMKTTLVTRMVLPLDLGVGWAAIWLTKREHYERAFDRCLVETMPGAQQPDKETTR